MKSLFTLILAIFVSSCATVSERTDLYAAFQAYRQHTTFENIGTVYSDYFTAALLDGESPDDPLIRRQLLFKENMREEIAHYQETFGDTGCLTVNGFNKSGRPLSFNIEYRSSNGRWLMNALHVDYPEHVGDLSARAKCPREFLQGLEGF